MPTEKYGGTGTYLIHMRSEFADINHKHISSGFLILFLCNTFILFLLLIFITMLRLELRFCSIAFISFKICCFCWVFMVVACDVMGSSDWIFMVVFTLYGASYIILVMLFFKDPNAFFFLEKKTLKLFLSFLGISLCYFCFSLWAEKDYIFRKLMV